MQMVGTGSTYVELKGKFTFSINQNGLDYNNKKERQEAIDDFWRCFNEFLRNLENVEHNFMSFDYDRSKVKVEGGE